MMLMRTRASNICLEIREKIISEIRVWLCCPSRILLVWLTSRFKANKISKICVYDVNFMALWHFFIYSPFISHTHTQYSSFFYEFYDIDNFIGTGTIFFSNITHFCRTFYVCFRCFSFGFTHASSLVVI